MSNYSTDSDLVAIRPNILSLGVADWEAMNTEARGTIDASLESLWYRAEARDRAIDPDVTPMDHDLLDHDQLKKLSCYAAFSEIYLYLTKDTPEPDGFERHRQTFATLYQQELQNILTTGVEYDWDSSDTITPDEKFKPRLRRLGRA